MLDIDDDILVERRALLNIFEGVSEMKNTDEKRVLSEIKYTKSLSKRIHASGLGAEIEIHEYGCDRIWTHEDVLKLLKKGAPCDAMWNNSFFHPFMYDSLITGVNKEKWTVSVLYVVAHIDVPDSTQFVQITHSSISHKKV